MRNEERVEEDEEEEEEDEEMEETAKVWRSEPRFAPLSRIEQSITVLYDRPRTRSVSESVASQRGCGARVRAGVGTGNRAPLAEPTKAPAMGELHSAFVSGDT